MFNYDIGDPVLRWSIGGDSSMCRLDVASARLHDNADVILLPIFQAMSAQGRPKRESAPKREARSVAP